MRNYGHQDIATRLCGFIVHNTFGWLGASPDAFVRDPSISCPEGIAEFKCPYSKRDIDPLIACDDPSFYCTRTGDTIHLQETHAYYHQVQLQLYVGMDLYSWCDFCIYTKEGVAVERIYLDTNWCNSYIPELESYFDAWMLPEIVEPRLKPSHYL